jgi:hypothetical protein
VANFLSPTEVRPGTSISRSYSIGATQLSAPASASLPFISSNDAPETKVKAHTGSPQLVAEMGVREKMKKAFGGKKSGDNSPSDAGTPRIPGVEYYKPGEIPSSKYRGKWDQAHQDKLHAFSFAAAFRSRRGSGYSSYSPSGLKAQSRRASHISRKSKSDVDDKSLRRKSTNPGRVTEDAEDQGDVTNGQ